MEREVRGMESAQRVGREGREVATDDGRKRDGTRLRMEISIYRLAAEGAKIKMGDINMTDRMRSTWLRAAE